VTSVLSPSAGRRLAGLVPLFALLRRRLCRRRRCARGTGAGTSPCPYPFCTRPSPGWSGRCRGARC